MIKIPRTQCSRDFFMRMLVRGGGFKSEQNLSGFYPPRRTAIELPLPDRLPPASFSNYLRACQNAANCLFSACFTAMHSISISQPGRHTGASTVTRGMSG